MKSMLVTNVLNAIRNGGLMANKMKDSRCKICNMSFNDKTWKEMMDHVELENKKLEEKKKQKSLESF